MREQSRGRVMGDYQVVLWDIEDEGIRIGIEAKAFQRCEWHGSLYFDGFDEDLVRAYKLVYYKAKRGELSYDPRSLTDAIKKAAGESPYECAQCLDFRCDAA
jgi:hypothetical protein